MMQLFPGCVDGNHPPERQQLAGGRVFPSVRAQLVFQQSNGESRCCWDSLNQTVNFLLELKLQQVRSGREAAAASSITTRDPGLGSSSCAAKSLDSLSQQISCKTAICPHTDTQKKWQKQLNLQLHSTELYSDLQLINVLILLKTSCQNKTAGRDINTNKSTMLWIKSVSVSVHWSQRQFSVQFLLTTSARDACCRKQESKLPNPKNYERKNKRLKKITQRIAVTSNRFLSVCLSAYSHSFLPTSPHTITMTETEDSQKREREKKQIRRIFVSNKHLQAVQGWNSNILLHLVTVGHVPLCAFTDFYSFHQQALVTRSIIIQRFCRGLNIWSLNSRPTE